MWVKESQISPLALPPELLVAAAVVGDISSVGNTGCVFVGRGVCVEACVGGKGVSVGIAACVSAIFVKAAAIAVPCISAGLAVGAAGAPQALMSIAMAITTMRAE